MEDFKLVLEVLERGPNGIEALGFLNGGIEIGGVDAEVLDEDESSTVVVGNGAVSGGLPPVGIPLSFDGVEEVSSGNRVNGVAELVV